MQNAKLFCLREIKKFKKFREIRERAYNLVGKKTSQNLRGCLLLRQSKMAFNGIRALPLMAFAVYDCLMAGAFLSFNVIQCHSLPFSEQSERLSFFVIQCHRKKSKITLQGFFRLSTFFLLGLFYIVFSIAELTLSMQALQP